MLDDAWHALVSDDERQLDRVERMDSGVDNVHRALLDYVSDITSQDISTETADTISQATTIANYLESIADIVSTQIIDLGRSRIRHDVRFSEETTNKFEELLQLVKQSIVDATDAMAMNDVARAKQIVRLKPQISQTCDDIREHLQNRLAADEPHRVAVFRIETDLLEQYNRIFYFAKRIAKLVAGVHHDEEVNGSRAATPEEN